ncbi:MAG: hypothetical protein U0361_21725 [Nitrospiraceae bacterium]
MADNPLALSKMHELAALVMELKEKFDYVIIDAPPVLPLADIHVLGSLADVLAYVVKAGVTGRMWSAEGLSVEEIRLTSGSY